MTTESDKRIVNLWHGLACIFTQLYFSSAPPAGGVCTNPIHACCGNGPLHPRMILDCAEFLECLLADLEDVQKDRAMPGRIDEIYKIKLANVLTCINPNPRSIRVHVHEQRLSEYASFLCVPVAGCRTLQESLARFVAGEVQDYQCRECIAGEEAEEEKKEKGKESGKEKRNEKENGKGSCGRVSEQPPTRMWRCMQRILIEDLPNTLIFRLKRFDFDMMTLKVEKVLSRFEFPIEEELDMAPYTREYHDFHKQHDTGTDMNTAEGLRAGDGGVDNSSSSSSSSSGGGGSCSCGSGNDGGKGGGKSKGGNKSEVGGEVGGEGKGWTELKRGRGEGYYRYRLTGIVVHCGSASYGHCYSYARERLPASFSTSSPVAGWFLFRDAGVRPLGEARGGAGVGDVGAANAAALFELKRDVFGGEDSINHMAYLLVYERVVPLYTNPTGDEYTLSRCSRLGPEDVMRRLCNEYRRFVAVPSSSSS